MADNKRYFKKEYDEEYYILDSEVISEEEFEEKLNYQGYKAFEDSLTSDEIVGLLNENEQLKYRLDCYKELYPTGKWIVESDIYEIEKVLSNDRE